jgi:hypothetical protein
MQIFYFLFISNHHFQNCPTNLIKSLYYKSTWTMGTGSFTGVKRPGRCVDHQPPSSAEVKESVEVYLYSPSGPSWPVLG